MGNRKFSFRIDDITEDLNWKNFRRIQEIFDQYKICPLLGVVPDNQDKKLKIGQPNPEFWSILTELEKKGWSLSQHGFRHCYLTEQAGLLGLKKASEFAGVSYKEQKAALAMGQRILELHGIRTDIFMAPGHTYDENTLKSLKELGFHYVTDGYTDCCYIRNGLTFIPCKSAGKPCRKGIDTICLHINGMVEEQFEELERIIRENRKDIVDFKDLLLVDTTQFGWKVRWQEYKNLRIRKCRLWMAQNEIVQEYLRANRSYSRYTKLPMLLGKLIMAKIQKR